MYIWIQVILFASLTVGVFAYVFKRSTFIYRNIKLGKPEVLNDHKLERIKMMLLVALGQKKMFQNVLPAILHLFIYVAFVITQMELLEIFIDGFTGQHRVIYHAIESVDFLRISYVGIISFIEILSVLALIATFAFLARRNILPIARFNKPELKGWPTRDANLILLFEIYLVTCIFLMNTADQAMHDGSYGFVLSSMLWPFLKSSFSNDGLFILERIGWWGHILGVFGFLMYLPGSKHLHILLAFPNTYYSRLEPKGEIKNMPEVTKEIRLMLNPDTAFSSDPNAVVEPVKFGAKDVQDLSWKHLLDAYACTECGRCTAACPANLTGKLLSPRKIMMDTRDRLEEVGKNIDLNNGKFVDDGKALIHEQYITVEELRACTTCNACVQECPVNINPLSIIIELRRHLILEESNSPEEWNNMFSNIENNGAPWKFAPQDRLKWSQEN